MTDLEHRLQDAVMTESAAYQPSADLPERIGRRVRARRRRARALAGGAMVVGAGVVAVLALQLPGDDEQGVVANDPSSTTTSSSETTTSTTTPTTTSTTELSPPPALDGATPLNLAGVGPIIAGMTVAEAEAASGVTFVTTGFQDFGGYCYYVGLEEQPDLSIRVRSPGDQPVSDPRDGIISVVGIYALDPDGVSERLTDAGVGLGSTEEQVRRAYEDQAEVRVEERPHDYVPDGAYLYVHVADSPDVGMRYVLDEHRVVTSIDVGEADGVTAPEGCA